MGLLEKILPKVTKDVPGARPWRTVTEYSPVFTSWKGSVYEQELTRACIDRFATACMKLKPCIEGGAHPGIRRAIETQPNGWTTWPKFLYRVATILEVESTAYVVPVLADNMVDIVGFAPMPCASAELFEFYGKPWVKFNLHNGDAACIELESVCILTRHQYMSDYVGEQHCIKQTMGLIHAQCQAQEAAIKNGAKIQFIGSLTGRVQEKDIEDKRAKFAKSNFEDNDTGLLLYDQTFDKVQQVEPKSYVISEKEMARIEKNVYTYFGTNEDVLQNKFDENGWGAFYEGRVEPFALQLGDGLTAIAFSQREQRRGNKVMFSANRLQYASNASKRNMVADMTDRGIMTLNEAREVLQLPPVEGGDIRVIRGEYINADDVSTYQRRSDEWNHKDDDNDTSGGEDDTYADR